MAATSYETVIGLETHVQLLTKSKMFCGCRSDYFGAEPNTHVCPVCLAMPGVLPVMNRQAVEYTMLTALALHCEIPAASKFDRKNYPYPDLVKGYQISQYDLPFSCNGWLDIEGDWGARRVGITRAHLEEDTAKLIHRRENGVAYSLIDVNRSGVPLMEVVSEPDMRSPVEARAYLQKLRLIVQTLGVSTGNMEEGAMRCDVNVSLRPVGAKQLGTKVEIKNLNSAHSVLHALEFEIERQQRALEHGERLVQETRGWDEDRGVTVSQRSKEQAHDYRYFPEPDLPPVFTSAEWVVELRARLPELPDERRERYMQEFNLSRYDAVQLTSSVRVAGFFEESVQRYPNPKTVANWIQGEIFRIVRDRDIELEALALTPEHLAELLTMLDQGNINQATAKEVLEAVATTGDSPRSIVSERGLLQISDSTELERLAFEAITANPQAVTDYRAGKKQAIGFLTGQVMRASKGKGNPAVINEILQRLMDAL